MSYKTQHGIMRSTWYCKSTSKKHIYFKQVLCRLGIEEDFCACVPYSEAGYYHVKDGIVWGDYQYDKNDVDEITKRLNDCNIPHRWIVKSHDCHNVRTGEYTKTIPEYRLVILTDKLVVNGEDLYYKKDK